MLRMWIASIAAVISVVLSLVCAPLSFAKSVGAVATHSRAATAATTSNRKLASKSKQAPPVPLLMQGDQSKAVAVLQSKLITLGYIPRAVANLRTGGAVASGFKPSSGSRKLPSIDKQLASLYQPGAYNTFTRAALMTFEAANNLAVDGIAGPEVAHALKVDLAENKRNPFGYTYVEVSEKSPETITIWHNGKVVLTSLCNTGVASAKTPIGTWPVYLRYLSQTMSGVTPWGTTYTDPGVPYVNYFNGGDAIHGFVRSSYGYPQSLGCVELPIHEAKKAWQWIHYGTLVTVVSPG